MFDRREEPRNRIEKALDILPGKTGSRYATINCPLERDGSSIKFYPVRVLKYLLPYQLLSVQILKDAFDNRVWLPIEYDAAQIKYDVQGAP